MRLLADYRVVVPVVTNEEIHRLALDDSLALRVGTASVSTAVLAGQIAVLRTRSDYGVRRTISYHHRVADLGVWAATLPAAVELMPAQPLMLWAGHVSGAQSTRTRRRVRDRPAGTGDELAVVTNAKVLGEGVDVPAVDVVVFTRPRRSAIDTIQAVGRALRTGGLTGKVSSVVVPLLLGEGESPEAALADSSWDPVWQILRVLRDHDDRLEEHLRRRRTALGEGNLFPPMSQVVALPSWPRVSGADVPDRFVRAITLDTRLPAKTAKSTVAHSVELPMDPSVVPRPQLPPPLRSHPTHPTTSSSIHQAGQPTERPAPQTRGPCVQRQANQACSTRDPQHEPCGTCGAVRRNRVRPVITVCARRHGRRVSASPGLAPHSRGAPDLNLATAEVASRTSGNGLKQQARSGADGPSAQHWPLVLSCRCGAGDVADGLA
jgi:hypothetical protein